MAEMFIMQRYMGSDDSEDGEANSSINRLEVLLRQAKKRRKKIQKQELKASEMQIESSKRRNTESSGEDMSLNAETIRNGHNISQIVREEPHRVLQQTEKRKKKLKTSEIENGNELAKNSTNAKSLEENVNLSQETVREVHNVSQIFQVKAHKLSKYKETESDNCSSELFSNKNISEHPEKIKPADGDEDYNLDADIDYTEKDQNVNQSDNFTVIGEIQSQKKKYVQRVLPEWLANPTVITDDLHSQECKVSEVDCLDKDIKHTLQEMGIGYFFPVQKAVISLLIEANMKRLYHRPSDICVSAPTGSGKTLAYVLPIIQCLKERVVCQIRALVILPVGDLAMQVFKVFESLCKKTCLNVELVVGKKTFAQEQAALVKESIRGFRSLADIIVATPGRLVDHINRTPGFSLQELQYLVLDEADRMMEEIQQGWLEEVEEAVYKGAASSSCKCHFVESLFKRVKPGPLSACSLGRISQPLQKLLFSATLSQDPEKLHLLTLFRPKLFTAVLNIPRKKAGASRETILGTPAKGEFIGKYTTPIGLKEYYVICETSAKPLMVSYLIDEKKFKRVLCFTKSVESAHRLHLVLNEMGNIKAREFSSALRPVQRKIILKQFAAGKTGILVCSDAMARGMDIENVDCVICYDAPFQIKTYVHRVGRTSRAGKEGVAITLLEESELVKFRKMLSSAGKTISELNLKYSSEEAIGKYKSALSSVANAIRNERKEKRNKMFLKRTVQIKRNAKK